MNPSARFVPALFFLPLLLASCGGNDPSDPGNRLSGVLSGDIVHADEYNRPLGDRSGVNVSVEGTSFSTVTNADGYWKFDELPSGICMIRYTRDGFAERRVQNFQFEGGGHYYMGETRLFRYPSYSIADFKVYVSETIHQPFRIEIGDALVTDTGAVVVRRRDTTVTKVVHAEKRFVMEGDIDQTVPAGKYRYVAVIFGSDASVSREPGRFRAIHRIGVYANGSHFHYTNDLALFIEGSELQAGEHVYVIACPSVPGIYYVYDDPDRRKARVVFPAPNHSAVIDLVLE